MHCVCVCCRRLIVLQVQQLLAFFRRAVDQCYNSLHEAFIRIDTDRSGTISAQELIALLYDHNVHASWSDILALVEVCAVLHSEGRFQSVFPHLVDLAPPPPQPHKKSNPQFFAMTGFSSGRSTATRMSRPLDPFYVVRWGQKPPGVIAFRILYPLECILLRPSLHPTPWKQLS